MSSIDVQFAEWRAPTHRLVNAILSVVQKNWKRTILTTKFNGQSEPASLAGRKKVILSVEIAGEKHGYCWPRPEQGTNNELADPLVAGAEVVRLREI